MPKWSRMESVDPQKHNQLSAIVLAAGMSRRMGPENKLLLKHRNSSLILETIDQLLALSEIREVLVVLGHEANLIGEHIKHRDVKIAYNQAYQSGQTSSIQTGVKACIADTNGFMICLGDMPLLQTQDYRSLITFWNQQEKLSIVRPIIDNKPGHPVIFDASYKTEILNEIYTEGCRTVIKKNQQKLIHFTSHNPHYLIDVDQPSDKSKLD